MEVEIILLLVGMVVGAMNSIAGGGMLFGFPVMLAVGMPPIVANASSHIAVLPGQVGSLIGFRKYLSKISNMYLLLLIPLGIGAGIGAYLLTTTSPAQFEKLLPILLSIAVALFIFEPYLHFRIHVHLRSRKKKLSSLALISVGLLPIAIYGGYFGIGFGFMLLALLGLGTIHDAHKLNAIKNVGTCTIATVTAIVLIPTGLIDWEKISFMAVGCGLGGYFGARLAQKFHSHTIRIIVVCIGLVSVSYLFVRTY